MDKKKVIYACILVVIFAFIVAILSSNSSSSTKIDNSALIEKLKGYETKQGAVIEQIELNLESNDKITMQRVYSKNKTVMFDASQEVSALKSDYNKDSNEYKAIENMELSLINMRACCDDGIKYLDSEEYKDLESYELNMKLSNDCINNYKEYASRLVN